MWIMLSDAFFSVVADPERVDMLVVRARMKGDIERVFPKVRVYATPNRDYQFRAYLPRETVALTIARQIRTIKYGNFKDSVKDAARHDAYLSVWTVMMRWSRGLFDRNRQPDWGFGDLDLTVDGDLKGDE